MGFNDLLTAEEVVKRCQGWEKNRNKGVNGQQPPNNGLSAEEKGARNMAVTNGAQLDDGRWNGQALSHL